MVPLAALDPADAVIGVSIGTWNGDHPARLVIANDNATNGASVTGHATATGNYCVRVYDVGKLTRLDRLPDHRHAFLKLHNASGLTAVAVRPVDRSRPWLSSHSL